MSRLYNLTEKWRQVANMLCEEEIDEQCILDTLESIDGEIQDKADNYAIIIKELLADANECKSEKMRLETRQKTFENRAKLLKDRLEEAMRITKNTKFKTALFSFNIQKNGGQLPLIIDKEAKEIPFEFYKHTEEQLDKTKIRAALDRGAIDFAHYAEQKESLRIK